MNKLNRDVIIHYVITGEVRNLAITQEWLLFSFFFNSIITSKRVRSFSPRVLAIEPADHTAVVEQLTDHFSPPL